MKLSTFISKHREEIDRHVWAVSYESVVPKNDSDRKDWILNDESLYNWARSEGVKI